jgi:hypothetical protein
LLDVVADLALFASNALALVTKRSWKVEFPATEGVLEDEGVEVVLDRRCSVFATSLTSYWSDMLRVLDEFRE